MKKFAFVPQIAVKPWFGILLQSHKTSGAIHLKRGCSETGKTYSKRQNFQLPTLEDQKV